LEKEKEQEKKRADSAEQALQEVGGSRRQQQSASAVVDWRRRLTKVDDCPLFSYKPPETIADIIAGVLEYKPVNSKINK
jgi:hypothetical protein